MKATYSAMNRFTGISLTKTMSQSFGEAYEKAVRLGLDMSIWVVCKS